MGEGPDSPGIELLNRLRGVGVERPRAHEELAGRARKELELAARSATVDGSEDMVVRVNKTRLREVLICEARLVARLSEPSAQPVAPVIAGRMMDLVFAQVAVGEAVPDDPVADSLLIAATAGDPALVADWEALSDTEQQEVTDTVETCSSCLADRWPALPALALLRLQEPLRVELAGGRVALTGRADVVVGRSSADRVGTTLVDIKSGSRRHDDLADAGWYAVLETVRHRTAPFQVGTYYLRDARLDLEVADEEFIGRAVARVSEGVSRLVRLAAGKPPDVTPNGLCPWCPALNGCEQGRRYIEERGISIPSPTRASEGDEDEGDEPF